MNFLALSLRLWSGLDVFQPQCGRRNPNAIALTPTGLDRITHFDCHPTRLKARGNSTSPRAALDPLARIQKHTAHIGDRTFNGTGTTTTGQLDLFDVLNLPGPARGLMSSHNRYSSVNNIKYLDDQLSNLWSWEKVRRRHGESRGLTNAPYMSHCATACGVDGDICGI